METLTALPVLFLVIFAFIFAVFFVIWPIVLLIQCMFDKRPGVLYKILTLVLTFTPLYPIPSFVYGAFIRKGFMSILALVSIGLLWISLILALVFATGTVVSLAGQALAGADGISWGSFFSQSSGNTQTPVKCPEPSGGNQGALPKDCVNVFEDGRRSNR